MDEELEGQGTETQGVQGQQPDNSGEGTNINPAWNDLLGVVPSQLHSQVIPHLQQWDKNYQDGMGKVHSEYEPFKAYQPFVDNQIDPEQLAYGLQILDAVQNRPQEVLEALQSVYGQQQELEDPQGSDLEQGQEPSVDIFSDPRMQQIQDMVTTMAQHLVQQNNSQSEAQADQELEQEFAQAKEQHGDFDENWVMAQILAGQYESVGEAAQAYQNFVKDVIANHNRPGPKVLSAGGQVPNQPVKPGDMSDKDRRATVMQMLQNAANQS